MLLTKERRSIEIKKSKAPKIALNNNVNDDKIEKSENIGAWFSPLPKLLIAEIDKSEIIEIPFADDVSVYSVRKNKKGEPVILISNSTHHEIELEQALCVPVQILGLISISSEAKKLLSRVESMISKQWPDLALDFFTLEDDGDIKKYRDRCIVWVQEQLINLQKKTAERNISLRRELVAVRKTHERMQNNFMAMEQFLAVEHMPLQLTFCNEPSDYIIAAPDDFPIQETVVQDLPVSSHGLAAIELHIGRQNTRSSGELKISLKTLEDANVVSTWNVPAEVLTKGWLLLALERTLDGHPQSMRLQVEWQQTHWEAPGITLGAVHPLTQFSVKLPSIGDTERALAMRLWRGLPGVRPSNMVGAIFPATDDERKGPIYLPKWVYSAVQRVNPKDDAGLPFEPVSIVNNGQAIQVHPLNDHVCVARLKAVCPADIKHVWATVKTAHPEASSLDYSLAVLEEGEPFESMFTKSIVRPDTRFSGWVTVAANTLSHVHLYLPKATKIKSDVYLAVRLGSKQSANYGWAQFQEIAFETTKQINNMGGSVQ